MLSTLISTYLQNITWILLVHDLFLGANACKYTEAGLTAPRYWAPQLVWTHRPIGLTAPSKLDLQPHLGFAPLDLQPYPESATFSGHSSSQRNQNPICIM